MKYYNEELINSATDCPFPVVIELDDNDVYVGYLVKSDLRGLYKVLGINGRKFEFTRKNISRITFTTNLLILPKNKVDKLKYVDLFEFNDLVNRAGYQII